MSQAIQIKRRNSGQAGPPSTLKAGEMAYNGVDGTLWYGAGDDGSGVATSIVAIGGPGTYAKLNAPTFTGVPAAPTANTGTSTTQIATTAFVAAAITALTGGAPGALDTLKELADAINDDASFAATVTNALALKAPLASPTFTGTPAAPTAAAGNNTNQLATTAFVMAAIGAATGTTAIDGGTF